MGHLNSLLQGGQVDQVETETSGWGASITSVSTEVGSLATRKGTEAISCLLSFLKPQSPKKIKSRQGEVKKMSRKSEVPMEYNANNDAVSKPGKRTRREDQTGT